MNEIIKFLINNKDEIIKNTIPVVSGVALTLLYNNLYNKYLYNRECENKARKFVSEYLGILNWKTNSKHEKYAISYKEYILDIIEKLRNNKLGYISAVQFINFYNNKIINENNKYNKAQGDENKLEANMDREIEILNKLYIMTDKERNYVKQQISKIEIDIYK